METREDKTATFIVKCAPYVNTGRRLPHYVARFSATYVNTLLTSVFCNDLNDVTLRKQRVEDM